MSWPTVGERGISTTVYRISLSTNQAFKANPRLIVKIKIFKPNEKIQVVGSKFALLIDS